MAMPLAVPRYTLQDLESFPDDGNRYELVDGFLLVTPSPASGFAHQIVQSRLVRLLVEYLGDRAVVLTPGVVEVMPDLHLEPDLLAVPTPVPVDGNWLDIKSFWLAVEVSGRGSRIYDRDFKRPAYLRAGVLEVWRADLKDRALFVSRPAQPDEARHENRLIWHSPAMATALAVDVPALFDGVRGDD